MLLASLVLLLLFLQFLGKIIIPNLSTALTTCQTLFQRLFKCLNHSPFQQSCEEHTCYASHFTNEETEAKMPNLPDEGDTAEK